MNDFSFRDKKILILSPQPWNYFFISKHHYALELAKDNDVWFLSAPQPGIGWKKELAKNNVRSRLTVIKYKLPLPQFFRFHVNKLYRYINRQTVKQMLKRIVPHFDLCIDFGCYSLYENVDFVSAADKIFFPVDNFSNMPFTQRGAQYLFTVSEVIRKKFSDAGISCHFINHGLSADFASRAKKELENNNSWKKRERITVGYSGNLFIRFLNRDIFRQLIDENREIAFHLFGSTEFNKTDAGEAEWFRYLSSQPNVFLRGFLMPEQLADDLQSMDALLLCYKADNKDYFGENTHKMLEYLSTGKAIISSHISLYADSVMISMTEAGNDEALPLLFSKTIKELEIHNSVELREKRIAYALDNTYAEQIKRIGRLVNKNRHN